MLNCLASLTMSTSNLKALPCKLDIKRHSPSILYISASLAMSTSALKALPCKFDIKRHSSSILYFLISKSFSADINMLHLIWIHVTGNMMMQFLPNLIMEKKTGGYLFSYNGLNSFQVICYYLMSIQCPSLLSIDLFYQVCTGRYISLFNSFHSEGAQWLSGRVLGWRLRGCRFKTHRHHCVVSLVFEQDTFILA